MRRIIVLLSLLVLSLGVATAATVTGKVVGPDGQPISGADIFVSLFLTGERQTLNLVTDAVGGYAFDVDLTLQAQRSSLASLTVYAPGYALADANLMEAAGNVVTLTPATDLRGTVVDAAGKPLAGIPVRLQYVQPTPQQYVSLPTEWYERFTAVTDAEGAWALPGIPRAGTVAVTLNDDRYVRERQLIKLIAGEPAPAVQFTARPGAALAGRVLTPEGAPAADARVSVYLPETAVSGLGKTAADGSYRITGLATGKYRITAFSEKQEWIVEPLTGVAVTEGAETAAPDLHARTGAVLEGTVTDAETGRPIPGATAMFTFGGGPEGQARRYGLRTDAKGHFFQRMLPAPGKLTVDNPPRGYLKILEKDGMAVDLQEGKTAAVTLQLRKGLTVTGTVVDQHGKPAAGVPCYINMPYDNAAEWSSNDTQVHFTTDEQGHFEASGLPPGKGTLGLSIPFDQPSEWEMPERLEIEVPAKEPLTITVTRKAMNAVTGRVVDANNLPLPGVTATFGARFGRGGQPQTVTAVTDDDGRYRLANIPEGTTVNLLTVTKEGYCRLPTGPLTNGGKATIDDAVMAACDATVRGTVRDAGGLPVADATVVSAESGLSVRAVTDAAGAFTLTEQPSAGELHLAAATPAGGGLAACTGNAAEVLITIKPGKVAKPIDLELAQELLDADREQSRVQRLFNRADTVRLIADIDFDLATRLALAGGELVSPGLRAYLLGKLAEKDPAAAARMGTPLLETIEDDDCRLYAAVELGIAVAQADPAQAEQCYQVAKAIYDRSAHGRKGYKEIEGLGMFGDISLRAVALAGVLRKTTDLEAMLAELSAEVKKDEGMGYMIVQPLMEAVGRVSPEFVLTVYNGIDSWSRRGGLDEAMTSLAKHDVAGAQRLLKEINAMPHEGINARASGPSYIIRALGKTDPVAALALANADRRSDSLLEAAPSQPKDVARKIVLDLFTEENNRTIMNVAKANAIDPELGKELYARYKENLEAESYNFTHRYSEDGSTTGDRVQYAYLISSLDPVEARLILETEYARTRANVEHGGNVFELQYFPQAMCPLDLDRAQEMLDALNLDSRRFFQQRIMQYILMSREERVSSSFF